MTYYQMNRTRIPYLADVNGLGWTPFGCGCSAGCNGCWARTKSAPRQKCPKCRAFVPHCHPERLDAPIRRNKPAVIGVQFTGDLLDPAHDRSYFNDVLATMKYADWHTYVVLTQRAERLADLAHVFPGGQLLQSDHVFWGVTIRNATELEARAPLLRDCTKNSWISYEPAWGPIGRALHSYLGDLRGVVIGCDNRRHVHFFLDWVEEVVDECFSARVPVYVKQIRLTNGGPLLTDPADFPPSVRARDLPWGPAA